MKPDCVCSANTNVLRSAGESQIER